MMNSMIVDGAVMMKSTYPAYKRNLSSLEKLRGINSNEGTYRHY